jgi:hypothetical protein
VYGQDYNKTSLLTACIESFQVLLHLGAALDHDVQQIDIKTAVMGHRFDMIKAYGRHILSHNLIH